MNNKKKKNRWLLPLILAVIFVVAVAIIGANIYNLMFGGSVTVSMEDVYSNIAACAPQLVLIGVAVVAVIVISIVVRKQNEAKRSFIRWESFLAMVLVVAIAVNWICLGTEYSLLSQVLADEMALSEETQAESLELAETIADEGIVLLKNDDDALPISTDTKLNVFGWGSTQPVYGGSGSGDVDESTATSLLQGLKDAGHTLNDDLSQFYVDYRSDRPEVGMMSKDWTIVQPTMEEYDEAGIFEQAVEFSDTAIIVLTRSGGEGMDLPDTYSSDCTYNTTQQGGDVVYSTQEDDIDSSKSYLELSNREIELVERVTSEFSNVIVIINSSNVMEMGWVDEYDNINAVLWVAGAGVNGFEALGEILSGEVNPSGKTVDTWVYDLKNTPTSNNFGEYAYTNSDEINGDTGEVKFVNYVESIYVGYKFYETAAVERLIDYDFIVQYPFGYGLSYTTFEQEISSFSVSGTTVTMEVTVTNTGSVAGKDVVEVYFDPPYTNGGIEKASANLLTFAKTSELAAGASETVTITFELEDMASYDDTGIKAEGGAYVLEAGDYTVSINSDSHTVLDSETITVEDDVIYNDENDGARSSDETAAVNQFDQARGDVTYLSRADGFANYEEATAAPTNYEMSAEQIAVYTSKATNDMSEYDDPDAEMPTTGADNGLALADMVGLDYDDPQWDDLLDQLTVDEMVNMVTDGGFKSTAMASIDAPQSVDSDGPASLTSNYNDNTGTAYPCATMIAATWNQELAYARGTQMGIEANELGITGWYGPAMDIHRSAFSGRNFEYYSEDGTLSGIMGGLEVKGATEQGVMVYLKHFVLNDQETNRTNGICTWTTEQALREIYLKAFESAFKDGNSTAVMTSFNSVGAEWAGSCEALLTEVLRNEWGFHGAVITDAMDPLADFYMDLNLGIRVGLTKGLSFSADPTLLSNTDDANTVIALRNAAHENLYAQANSNALELNDDSTATWVMMFYVADAALAVILIAAAIVTYRSYKKELAEAEAE
ncbi:MAG: glycoside hydrolase family 3 C-terminal domain-containing protein [Clostridiales bacterium]|nr:glycoside hydrolase family 3 C-terminal domain-containing protein [Clostridiales bacterium]